MNEKSLLSLREIARELNLKYKTILNFKNQLEPFLPGVFDGRNFKYFPDSKEILELIAALRGEGFTFSMIKEIFLENHKVENDPQMYEWVCECIGKHKHHWAQIDGSACASVDQSGSACASMDLHGSGCASTDQSGSIQANSSEMAENTGSELVIRFHKPDALFTHIESQWLVGGFLG